MFKSSEFASQAVAMVMALAISISAFGVTVAPQDVNLDAPVSQGMMA